MNAITELNKAEQTSIEGGKPKFGLKISISGLFDGIKGNTKISVTPTVEF